MLDDINPMFDFFGIFIGESQNLKKITLVTKNGTEDVETTQILSLRFSTHKLIRWTYIATMNTPLLHKILHIRIVCKSIMRELIYHHQSGQLYSNNVLLHKHHNITIGTRDIIKVTEVLFAPVLIFATSILKTDDGRLKHIHINHSVKRSFQS